MNETQGSRRGQLRCLSARTADSNSRLKRSSAPSVALREKSHAKLQANLVTPGNRVNPPDLKHGNATPRGEGLPLPRPNRVNSLSPNHAKRGEEAFLLIRSNRVSKPSLLNPNPLR